MGINRTGNDKLDFQKSVAASTCRRYRNSTTRKIEAAGSDEF